MKVTLYQKHLTGRLKHMVIEVNDNQIFTEWWTSKDEEDGKKQNTKETISGKNKGRSNETSDNEQAILEFERKVKKKKEEGYVENREDAVIGEIAVVSSVLTQAFAPSKPISKLKEKDDPYDGNWLAERKHNGSCILLHNTGNEQIGYTRRIKPITGILSVVPQIKDNLKLLPDKSLVIGELVAIDGKGIEDPKVLKAVTTETTTEAKALLKYNSLIDEGYEPPKFRDDLKLPGTGGRTAIAMVVKGFKAQGKISEHDEFIAKKLAYILTGGDKAGLTKSVDEQYLLDIEREAFVSLTGEKLSQDRIRYMLKAGKPLRN